MDEISANDIQVGKPIYNLEGKPKIAYFSMEIGIDEHIPTSSGGLGVLSKVRQRGKSKRVTNKFFSSRFLKTFTNKNEYKN